MKHQILVLEDDMDMQEALRVSLRDFDCLFCMTLAQGLQEAAGDWDLILLDLGLPDGNGLELLQAVRLESDVPVLVLSAQTDQPVILEAYAQKADDYITKPVRLPVLKAKIGRLLENALDFTSGPITLAAGRNPLDQSCELTILHPGSLGSHIPRRYATQRAGHYGIGLALAAAVAEKHQGSLQIREEKGQVVMEVGLPVLILEI